MNSATIDELPWSGGRALIGGATLVAVVGLALLVVGAAADLRQAYFAYLIAYTFAVSVIIGLLAFIMSAHAMNAGWPVAVRRLAEAGSAAMPLLAVLVVPLLVGAGRMYPWAHPALVGDPVAQDAVRHKHLFMNPGFFIARALVCVAVWTLVAEQLRRWSIAMDEPAPADLRVRLRAYSCGLLPALGITGTVAAFDWLMSLSPDFYSTMYGLYVLSGGFVAAIGLVAVLVRAGQRTGHLSQIGPSHVYALGRLLFAFLIFWAYTAFFQLLIIWLANKPVEARFYLQRIQPGDRWTSWFLIWGAFAAPWLALLSYRLKRDRFFVPLLGAWILACHYVDMHWLVGAHRGGAPWRWHDLPALLFIGGASVAFAAWRQRGHLLAACHDPDYARAIAYRSR